MKKSVLLGSTIMFAASAFATANAQEGDEIVVFATKREQTLQEVPVAVSVVPAETLERTQINDLLDLQSVVPSLRVSQLQQSGNSTFIIRGFGNGANNTGIEPSVGVFIDGVYRSRSAGAISDFPAVERVEVLRGPQSTLFGKNASAGVISFVTAKPSFTPTGSVEATYGNYDQKILKGYYSGPISENTAISIAGSWNERDGYAENIIDGTDLNERNRWGVRGQMLYQASDNIEVRLIADYDHLDEVCCYTPNIVNGPTGAAITGLGGVIVTDPFGYETALDVNPTNEIINYGASAHVDWDLGWATLTSITAGRKQELVSDGDVDFTSLNAIQENLLDNNIETKTQELRLTSPGTGAFDWLLGVFYFDELVESEGSVIYDEAFDDYANALSGGATGALEGALGLGEFFEAGTGTREFFKQENESYSIFGQGDWHVTERLTATLGIAYTSDEKTVSGRADNDDLYASLVLNQAPISNVIGQIVFGGAFQQATGLAPTPANIGAFAMAQPAIFAQIQAGAAAATPGAIAGLQGLQFLPQFIDFPNEVENGQSEDSDTTYTARLAFDVTPSINVYGSISTGFKASSWNLTRDSSPFAADFAALGTAGLLVPNRAAGTRFAGPEETLVYELGLKANFPRGSVNLAIFDQTIEGFQSAIFQGTGFVLANAGEQSTTGLEIDAVFNPIDALTLTFGGVFLDPVYDEYLNAPGPNGPTDLSGETPAGIHTTSLAFGAQYEADLGDGKTGFIRADYQFENEIPIVDNVPESVAVREVNLVNASAGLTCDNGMEIFVWGRNLTNDEYFQSGFPTTAQAGSFNGYPNQPQTYGITLRKRW